MIRPAWVFPSLLILLPCIARADGPADNIPTQVRRIPGLGIDVGGQDRDDLEAGLKSLEAQLDALRTQHKPWIDELLPDVLIFHKAVRDALVHRELFAPQEIGKARSLLEEGRDRANQLANGAAPWTVATGCVVRGYRSRIDGSIQPYGLVVPPGYAATGTDRVRLDIWFHGRGETLSEVNFLDERRRQTGLFAPRDAIVLHPYGRYCNAFKFAGETDVYEALDDVQRRYRVDEDRISVRGFSMGGAGCWQFAVHDSSRWFAANPGAGFAETPRFLNVFQKETVAPTWYEKKLWRLYDCPGYALNLTQCPTVAYSGDKDSQKQAADIMTEALATWKIPLTHVIGKGMGHRYDDASKAEVESRLASLARRGRDPLPDRVAFETYTLKYNRMNWVTIGALNEHWERASVVAELLRENPSGRPTGVAVQASNVAELTLEFPAGWAPFEAAREVRVVFGDRAIQAPPVSSDRSWICTLHREAGEWKLGALPMDGPRKRHNLQGPIDDAFMDSFVFVRPTGRSGHAKVRAWVDAELARALEHWRRHFRGEARVVDDVAVTPELAKSSHLVLWGELSDNAYLARIAGRLSIRCEAEKIQVGATSYSASDHALILIQPNPEAADRYVVLNSSFTFRDYDYLNNARQVPKLPDWAVVNLGTPPGPKEPGKVVAADFFDESWKLRPAR